MKICQDKNDERAFLMPRILTIRRTAMWTEGQVLQSGKYKVVRRIGGGGFGLTYLATDDFFDRQVVIKTPNETFKADQDYERYVRRFQREGQALARLKHPNIVGVLGFFQEVGIPCLVMTYVEGVTLHERLRIGNPFAEDEAVQTFRKLAAALHQVHQAGIFHCDIHPGNIMLQQSGEPVLIDFGSAKLLHPTTITVTTTVNQSFSPYEQQDPTNHPKATLDVYGLAATLFFAVTGTKPSASITRKLYGDTVEFSPTLKSTLSSWLRDAILKGMALEEQNRPADMQVLGELLYPQPIQPAVQVPASGSIVDKPVAWQREQAFDGRQKSISQSTQDRPPSQLFFQKRMKAGTKQSSGFPWISLSLFLLGNIPTGACMWWLGDSSTVDAGAWAFVFAGLLSTTLAGVLAGVLALSLTGAWAVTLAGAIAVAWAWALSGAWAGAWAWAGTVAVAWTWAGAAAWAVAWAVTWAVAWAVAVAVTVAGAGAEALALALALAGAGLLGACSAGADAHEANANWAGVGGSAIALAGLMAGLSTTLLSSAVQNITIFVLCLLQIVLLVRSLKPTIRSLSGRYSAIIEPFIILNVACIVGMLGGAGLAEWVSAATHAAR